MTGFHRGYGEISYDPEPRPRPDWVADAPETVTQAEADAAAWRAFWRGVFVGAVAIAASFAAGAAWSGTTVTIGAELVRGEAVEATTVSIARSDEPGAWAVVSFSNRALNDGGDDGDYAVTLDGVTVALRFTWEAVPMIGSDRITVTPPDGMTCIPAICEATVLEGFTGRVVLIDWRGM